MKDKLIMISLTLIGIVVVVGFIYGSYWIAKNVSYYFFYGDMVQQTVREMVKPEYLNQ